MGKISAVAVQACFDLRDYASLDAFEVAVGDLTRGVAAELDGRADHALVVFPEHLGFLLAMVPFHRRVAQRSDTFEAFISEVAGSDGGAKVGLVVEHAVETAAAYESILAEVARGLGAYVVGGSITLPAMDASPHAGGLCVLDDTRLYNVSPLFSPTGRCLGRTAKVRIPRGEDQWASAGSLTSLRPVETRLGSIGVAICYDGYHHRPLEVLDAAGCEIVAQPIHFPDPALRYDGSGGRVPRHEDFGRLLQRRENVRFGICAALVGETFSDRRAEGLSQIVTNSWVGVGEEDSWVVATAQESFAQEFVSATIVL